MEASKLRRLINWLIDNIGVLLILALLVRAVSPHDAPQWQVRLGSIGLLSVYYVIMEYFFQRSLGKFCTRTLVVTLEDDRPGLGAVLLRTLCRFLPLEPASLLFHRTRAWHDLLSRTKVVFVNY